MASPPSLSSLNIPRKRPSVASVSSASKKRKPSGLRHSLPAEEGIAGSPLRFSRSPSVDSMATGSLANGVGGRGRRKKGADERSVTGSAREGKAGSAVADAGAEEEEDDDEDEGEGMDAVLEGKEDEEEKENRRKKEKENERILLDAMTQEQQDRYSTYRRIKLKKEIVRKITNQTLSQSVPPGVIIAMNAYTKVFIGQLIDRALTVRDEWCASRTHMPNPDLPPELLRIGLDKPSGHRYDAKPTQQDIQQAGLQPSQVDSKMGYWVEVPKDATLGERLKMQDKGPLTPDHLREALRRYKKDTEGGGAGFAGMSLEGVERTAGRMGGKKLFR